MLKEMQIPQTIAELLPVLLESSVGTAVLVDRDQRTLYCSAHEYEVEPGQPVVTLVSTSDRASLEAAVASAFSDGAGTELMMTSGSHPEKKLQLRIVPLRIRKSVEAVAVWCNDVTSELNERAVRDADHQLLKESEQRFRTIIEQAPEAIVLLDPEAGVFVEANENALRLFGMSRAEVLQQNPLTLSPVRQPDGVLSSVRAGKVIKDALEGGFPVFEWTHLNIQGDEVQCELRLALLEGQQRLIRGSITNITTRKAAEAEREALQNQLYQAQKMEAIGQLTGGVAHDFNNLLTVIQGNLDMLEMFPADTHEILAEARGATERAAALTQRLLAFSRKQPLRPQVLDIAALVDDMLTLVSRGVGPTIDIEINHDDELWPCEADGSQVESVLLNLALNARDAMPGGGKLLISTGNRSVGTGSHPQYRKGDYVYLEVSDNGVGMSGEVLTRATEPFFTTKAIGDGSGLGLSMIYGFAEQSGGFMSLRSTQGVGSRVRVYLPRARGQFATALPEPIHGGHGGHGEWVLVVEDEPAVMHVTQLVLSQLGYRVHAASNADEALKVLRSDAPVDLLFTDVVLTGSISGFELAHQARALRFDLPILCTSGYPQGELPGDFRLLDKPFTRAGLNSAIRATLGGPQMAASRLNEN